MKNLKQIINEKLIINKHSKSKKSYVESLEELKTKYELDYIRISNSDRRYIISDKLGKKFLKFMRQPRVEIDITLNKFIEDNNLLDTKKYNCHIISGDNKSLTTYYYIVIYNKDDAQTVAQIIYRYNEEIRIYTGYMKTFNCFFAKIIDFILQYEES